MEFNNLDAEQLKQVISNASSALNRRQKVEKAAGEIQRILKKYKLSKDELKTLFASVQSSKAVSISKPKSVRAKVEPKYQSRNGEKHWTGRGRAPSWVLEICQSKGLTVEGFKLDRRFLIKNSKPSSTAADQS